MNSGSGFRGLVFWLEVGFEGLGGLGFWVMGVKAMILNGTLLDSGFRQSGAEEVWRLWLRWGLGFRDILGMPSPRALP